jgi:hypothetical protein
MRFGIFHISAEAGDAMPTPATTSPVQIATAAVALKITAKSLS